MDTSFPSNKKVFEYILSIIADKGNIDAIIFKQALKNNVKIADIINGSREQGLVKIRRQIAIKASEYNHTPDIIAEHLNKDRTTILHYLNTPKYETDE